MIPKFRAWHIIDKKMISWKRLLNGHNLRNVFMRPEMCNLKLMQSTGLKDKNDVVIFEGDIVLVNVINGFDNLVNEKTIVQESEFHSGLICKSLTSEMEYRLFKRNKMGYEYEIIGNIYENPDLLDSDLVEVER
ncbi:YopX family protein [Enterococcus sp. AZ172]|uniref:YopX family protein n=1 Tax=unclassified Enterococcus TaxID=2608891 RepID=UPI003F28DA26